MQRTQHFAQACRWQIRGCLLPWRADYWHTKFTAPGLRVTIELGRVFNYKNQSAVKALKLKFFEKVFMFSMNDKVVHTEFDQIAHYLRVLYCRKLP